MIWLVQLHRARNLRPFGRKAKSFWACLVYQVMKKKHMLPGVLVRKKQQMKHSTLHQKIPWVETPTKQIFNDIPILASYESTPGKYIDIRSFERWCCHLLPSLDISSVFTRLHNLIQLLFCFFFSLHVCVSLYTVSSQRPLFVLPAFFRATPVFPVVFFSAVFQPKKNPSQVPCRAPIRRLKVSPLWRLKSLNWWGKTQFRWGFSRVDSLGPFPTSRDKPWTKLGISISISYPWLQHFFQNQALVYPFRIALCPVFNKLVCNKRSLFLVEVFSV